jgi:hypothetical protein
MSIWFALLGLGLAPVMVGATEVIVGNAPMELSGVAGGLQQAAMQIGGSLGTAVLGAVMASKVDGDLAGNWADAGLPKLTPAQLDQAKEAVQVGAAPVAPGTPPEIAEKITGVAHDTFISGMSLASLVAAGVAVVAVFVAFLTKRGRTRRRARESAHISDGHLRPGPRSLGGAFAYQGDAIPYDFHTDRAAGQSALNCPYETGSSVRPGRAAGGGQRATDRWENRGRKVRV